MVPIRSTIESGFALPPISEFEKLITPKTKAILICNPSNPTGYLYSKAELESLRDLVKNMTCGYFQMKYTVNSVTMDIHILRLCIFQESKTMSFC